ncbi:hypothetical protein ACFVHQ_19370 [Actinomycetes bacterium NPDC127524]
MKKAPVLLIKHSYYAILKHVLAVDVTGREKLSKEVISDINEQNYKLLGTIYD